MMVMNGKTILSRTKIMVQETIVEVNPTVVSAMNTVIIEKSFGPGPSLDPVPAPQVYPLPEVTEITITITAVALCSTVYAAMYLRIEFCYG